MTQKEHHINLDKTKFKKDFDVSIKTKTSLALNKINKTNETKVDNQEKYKIKSQTKQLRVIKERNAIIIPNKKREKEGGDLVENFQYYESKNLSKNNKESIVLHKRKGNPFYQTVINQKNLNYTHGERSGSTLGKNENKINTIKTRTQRNQYQNKTYNTTKVTKTTQERINRNNNDSSNQRTINVEEKRKNIPYIHFEKTYTETNKRKITNVEQNKDVLVQKKLHEKTKETKRTSEVQNNKKALDSAKNKINFYQNKFQQKKEEIQKSFIYKEQNIMKEESGKFLCPNCGKRLFGDSIVFRLEKWKSRENNGIKKFIFYGYEHRYGMIPGFHWYGKMETIYHGSFTDSGESCGVKRNIHVPASKRLSFKKNDSIESCWKEAFTDKEWDKALGKSLGELMCLFCNYKSNFIDFIKATKSQTKQ